MLLGFKKQFAPKILDGSKQFTIRNPRKREPKIGETLHMYTGLRTKKTQKITSKHSFTGISLVDIFISKIHRRDDLGRSYGITVKLDIRVDLKLLNQEEAIRFIHADGFASPHEFVEYWIAEKAEVTKHFQDGQKEPLIIQYTVKAKDLVIYHWTDLRF